MGDAQEIMGEYTKRKGIETGRRKGRERGGEQQVCEILRLVRTPSLEAGVLTLLSAGKLRHKATLV